MILSDKSIAEMIEMERLEYVPLPNPEQIQPASLDVRIGDTLHDPKTDDRLETLIAQPGQRYHAYTRSRIGLPDDLAAQLTGRSTIGRAGLIIHKTAGWIDPGFSGNIKFEIYNFGDEPYEFHKQQRVGQLVFFPLDRPSQGYDGQYQDQEPGSDK